MLQLLLLQLHDLAQTENLIVIMQAARQEVTNMEGIAFEKRAGTKSIAIVPVGHGQEMRQATGSAIEANYY